jgi:adenosylcobyric acid synthase
MAQALMVVGTASHVGKSWMATAICRHLCRRGLRVAPFKAQNMSLNSYACRDGGEIGRAQVAQAEACGLEPTTDMNPILLKPTSATGSQVVVNGKVWKQLSADAYYREYEFLFEQVLAAYQRLADAHDFIVLEGAGGTAEINLRERDLVNLPLAERLDVPALLVADIDRGGVFASVVGTLHLLSESERSRVRSFAVNRFRGDPGLFGSGRAMLEERAERPCLGVFPFSGDIELDAEDSVSLDNRGAAEATDGELDIAIIRLPHISNFTDFRLLTSARYIEQPTTAVPDIIILPGSKNTIADLHWLRGTGLAPWILKCHSNGSAVWGICGGYQMLGRRVVDPARVESLLGEAEGLGLIDAETTLAETKVTRIVAARSPSGEVAFSAYEIHMGETSQSVNTEPFALVEGRPEGFHNGRVLGTYLHGALEDNDLLLGLLERVARRRGKSAPLIKAAPKNKQYDRLADWFEENADMGSFEELYLS